MSKEQRTIWDDIIEVGREIVETLDEALNPEKRRKPAPVPIPIRNNPPVRDPNNGQFH